MLYPTHVITKEYSLNKKVCLHLVTSQLLPNTLIRTNVKMIFRNTHKYVKIKVGPKRSAREKGQGNRVGLKGEGKRGGCGLV